MLLFINKCGVAVVEYLGWRYFLAYQLLIPILCFFYLPGDLWAELYVCTTR